MPKAYHTWHCAVCRRKLGEQRQKVTFQREEPYSERHPSWLTWKSKGCFYLCDECAASVRELVVVHDA